MSELDVVEQAVLTKVATKLRLEAAVAAKTSRDYGRGMSYAAALVEDMAERARVRAGEQ